MSASFPTGGPVRDALARQGRLLDELERVLAEESQALRARDAEALERCAREKAALVEALEQAHRHLRSSLQAPAGKDGIAAALAEVDPGSALGAEWERQRRRLADLRARNRANGGLIALARHTAERALAILCGRGADVPTYGPGGERPPGPAGRILGRT